MPKLTDAQARVLRAMRDGGHLTRRLFDGKCAGARWVINAEQVPKMTAEALMRKSLISSCVGQDYDWVEYSLTPAGREALAAWEKANE